MSTKIAEVQHSPWIMADLQYHLKNLIVHSTWTTAFDGISTSRLMLDCEANLSSPNFIKIHIFQVLEKCCK